MIQLPQPGHLMRIRCQCGACGGEAMVWKHGRGYHNICELPYGDGTVGGMASMEPMAGHEMRAMVCDLFGHEPKIEIGEADATLMAEVDWSRMQLLRGDGTLKFRLP